MGDNPILLKHVRSRLRPERFLPQAIGVVVLSGFLVWSTVLTGNVANGRGLIWLLVFQGFLLFVLGSVQVAGAIAGARNSGILDFHRISPVSPLRIAVGFVMGSPVAEWALFGLTVPFVLALPLLGYGHVDRIAVCELLMVGAALLYHCGGAVTAAVVPNARNAEALAASIPMLLQVAGLYLSASFPIMDALNLMKPGEVPRFFGFRLGWITLSLLHQVPLAAFLFAAVVRRMDRDDRPVYARPVAIGFLAWIGVMLLGDTAWASDRGPVAMLPALFGTLAAAAALIWLITPNAGHLANAMRRHRKLGRAGEPDPWTDNAPNALPVLAAVALVMGFALGGARPSGLGDPDLDSAVRAVLFAGAGLTTWGFGLQGAMVTRRRAEGLFLLFLFGVWVVPLLAGTLLLLVKTVPPELPAFFFALNPIAGIVASATRPGSAAVARAVDLALGLSLTLAVAGAYWGTRQVRRVEARAITPEPGATMGGDAPTPPPRISA